MVRTMTINIDPEPPDPTNPDAYKFGWLALQEHFSKESE